MAFWNDPKNRSLKVLVLVLVIGLCAWFTFKHLPASTLGSKAQVYDDSGNLIPSPDQTTQVNPDGTPAETPSNDSGGASAEVPAQNNSPENPTATPPQVYPYDCDPGTLNSPCFPAVLTTSASAITSTSATINGKITGLGHTGVVTSTGFTGSFGSAIETPASITTAPTSFSQPLTGLTCNTTYTFTANASNSGMIYTGMGTGSSMSFTTAPCPIPLALVTDGIVNISQTSALIFATVTATGGSTVTSTGFTGSFGAPISTPASITVAPSGFHSTLTGLTCGTAYTVAPSATNGSGTASGTGVTFSTLPCPGAYATLGTSGFTLASATAYTFQGAVSNPYSSWPSANVSFDYAPDSYYTSHGSTYSSNTGNVFLGITAHISTWPITYFNATTPGLTCGVKYDFRAKAIYTGGPTSYGVNDSFTACQ